MHNAFNILPVLRQLPVRIESAAAYSDRLLLGTSSGALLVYRATESGGDKPPQLTLLETKKAFSRRSIERLSVIKEAGVLVCLADGLVTLYDLHTLSNATPLANTKSANVLAVHTAVDHIDGIPTLVSKLAVHAKRKVVVLEWRDAEFYKTFEYSAADKIIAMQFASPNLLALATAREFLTLQLPRGQWDDLFPADTASLRTVAGVALGGASGAATAAAAADSSSGGGGPQTASNTPAPSTSGGGGGGGMWGSWAIGLAGSANEAKATIARMPGEKLLLCHEDIGVFINSAGKLCHREYTEPIVFARAPTEITYTSSYAIAVSQEPSGSSSAPASGDSRRPQARFNVEVRNIATQALVQSLHLSEEPPTGIINGSGGKQVWAIGPHTVWRLMPVPIQQQVEEVLSAGQYDEAISLVAQSDSILESEKQELTIKIRWLRARWLFRDQAKYEEALNEFTDLDATPTEAIALCPERIAGDLAEDDESDVGSVGDNDDNDDGKGADAPETEDAGTNNASPPATPPTKKRLKPKQVIWKEALYALMRYLTEHRRVLQRAITENRREQEYVVRVLFQDEDDDEVKVYSEKAGRSRSSTVDDDSLPHVRLKRLAFSLERMGIPVAAMAQVVDTTLLKVYLECSPGLLGPLLRVKNHCDVEQSEGLLLEHKRYSELVDLYHGKGLFRNALQLLQSQGKSSESGLLHGSYPVVRYLLRLPAEQFELVLEYVKWPIQIGIKREQSQADNDGASGSDSSTDSEDWPSPSSIVSMVFADDRPAAEQFPRLRVAAFLRQMSSKLAIQYLTYVFDSWDDQTPALHDDMAASYLDLLTSGSTDNADYDKDLRSKLQRFLRTSKFYSPEKALARLPESELFEERALVLSRLGRHDYALNLLVFGVANLALAEQYCVDNVVEHPAVFVLLLGILVSKPPADAIDREADMIRSGLLSVSETDKHETEAQIETVRQKLHWQYAGHLLSVHHQNIPAADALGILPLDMDFSSDILKYLRSQLCALDQGMRSTNIVQNLRVGADQQARRQLSRVESSYVIITDTRTCPQCLKRIGSGTAFAVIPPSPTATSKGGSAGHTVVHYSCWQRHKPASKSASKDASNVNSNGDAESNGSEDDDDNDGTATLATFALAVAGTAFAAGAEPSHAVKGKAMNSAAAPAAAAAPEARTVTVTTTVNGAGVNQASFAAAALAGALAFASYI
ncbi:Vacuolar morphogenesis protein 6 [Coemansia erecta]|uniref:Vacuolar morphogenesis protein 6 n=1 Tax=Coemansia erecta TaxID=147472 RepID=A0A9W7Y2Q9_9FUNG|nr:Vacuolar morphogenesis protein 6 [Coemansia erecta]